MNFHADLTPGVVFGLGWGYLLLSAMNFMWARQSSAAGGNTSVRLPGVMSQPMDLPKATVWWVYSFLLLLIAFAHLSVWDVPAADRFPMSMPNAIRHVVNLLSDPRWFFALSLAGFLGLIYFREWWVQPTVAWVLLNLSILFLLLSITDYDFRQIVGKPDNVPIVAMLFIVGFFTWWGFSQAVENDRRTAMGLPILPREKNEKVLVWPDLVYTELICMILITAVLIAWGIALPAPLEEPASAAKTPNPSKAPWYFLGLQEMLVYYDPWMAGVVLPSVMVAGLMAIPYLDYNKLGNGYYTFKERSFAISVFLFGFLPLWVALIILGTFLRGPNWNIFGPYEYWDVHKLEFLNNVNLSEYFWYGLRQPLPVAPAGSDLFTQVFYILLREGVGIVLVLGYFLFLPQVLAATICRQFYLKMGVLRFMVFANLLLFMMALPIKMVLRWAVNLKYIIAIPEWFLNF